jgi:hypothetical protein
MENIEKYVEFFHTSFPRGSENSEWFSKMSSFAFGKITSIGQWWHTSMLEFSSMSGTGNGGGNFIFTYVKSCQYTDHVVELKTKELSTENQELKSLIYGMLDEINELKEHNKSLSERILLLENKPPIILY